MIVVADASPLNYLVRLGHIDVLPLLFGQVIAPAAVLQELRHRGAPEEVRTWAADPPAWLQTGSPERVDETLSAVLGAGERDAISLALQMRAELLLIDEAAGRREAKLRNIPVTGTLTVLYEAALLDRLDFQHELGRLRYFNFRSSVALERIMLAQLADAKRSSKSR